MATITLRSVKGSPLTNNEVDSNFSNLNNDKLESSSYNAADVLTKLKTVDGAGSGLDADLLDGYSTSSSNTSNTVVIRDASGNFSAGTITAALSGNASTATALQNARLIAGQSFNGTANITIASSDLSNSSEVVLLTGAQNLSDKTLEDTTFTGTITANGSSGSSGFILQSTGTGVQWSSSTITLNADATTGAVNTGGTLSIDGTSNRITSTVSGDTITLNTPQDLHTTADFQVGSLGVGTPASGTSGEIRAAGDIVAGYSDERLKTNIAQIENALDKVMSIRGVTYTQNSIAESLGFNAKEEQVGVIAQEVEAVLPQVVKHAPFDILRLQEGLEISKSGQTYKTVQYEKLVPLLIEAIKELNKQVQELKNSKE